MSGLNLHLENSLVYLTSAKQSNSYQLSRYNNEKSILSDSLLSLEDDLVFDPPFQVKLVLATFIPFPLLVL